MRILLTTDTIGGVWTFTMELATGLLARGHNVVLVSFGLAPSPVHASWSKEVDRKYGSVFRYVASSAPLEWMRSNDGAYSKAEPLLQRTVSEFAPDILHANQFCFGNLSAEVPTLITAHSDVYSWGTSCNPSSLLPSRWLAQYRSLVQNGLNGADAIVAPTRWMLDALSHHFELPSATHVISNGRTLPSCVSVEPRNMQAVSVGRLWDEAKNLRLLTCIDAPLPLLVAGERQHEDCSVDTALGSITWLGTLAESALLKLFRQSSIYLAPSIYEPFGLAPLEAALCGCAIVANDLPSLREIWGDTALYFQDEAMLVHLLSYLCAFPAELKRAQQNARRRALQLSASRMTDAYLNLYTGLLPSKSAQHEVLQEYVADAV